MKQELSSRKWRHPEGYKFLAPYSNAVLLRFLIRKFTETLPLSEQRRKSQLDDAGRSVVSNIEEGYKRPTTKEYLAFLGFSQGSLEEVKGLFRQAHQDGFLRSKVGSSLKDIGVDLREFKGRIEESKGDIPLNILYSPLSPLTASDLTFEMLMELCYKTDYLFRRLTASLEKSVTKIDVMSPMNRWRWQKMEEDEQRERTLDEKIKKFLRTRQK